MVLGSRQLLERAVGECSEIGEFMSAMQQIDQVLELLPPDAEAEMVLSCMSDFNLNHLFYKDGGLIISQGEEGFELYLSLSVHFRWTLGAIPKKGWVQMVGQLLSEKDGGSMSAESGEEELPVLSTKGGVISMSKSVSFHGPVSPKLVSGATAWLRAAAARGADLALDSPVV